MITCPSCGSEHPLNTVFCEECGSNLSAQQQKQVAAQKARQRGPLTGGIRLHIVASGRQLDLPCDHQLLIGRRDAPQSIVPDIDLTDDGGLEAGVSRRHAQISFQQEQVLLQDLGSTNGTLVNHLALSPYLGHPLHSGDEIKLGNVTLRVEFID